MDRLYVFIIRNDIWIYLLCILGLVWYLAELVRARRLLRSAMFGLERERGQRMQNRAALLLLFFVSVIALVAYVNLQIAQTLPTELLKPPTPTPNIFSTPLSSPIPQGGSEGASTATLAIAPTVTLVSDVQGNGVGVNDSPGDSPTEVSTETAFPDVVIGDCVPDVAISAPPSGVSISGEVAIFGTANPDNFGYYDIEILGPATGGRWISIFDALRREPLIDDILATIDVAGLENGSYLLRLLVMNTESVEAGQCIIQVEVE
ncbi:MAG: hypothetical protein WA996_06780 [Candidatus Promineifilaceae bacterium]